MTTDAGIKETWERSFQEQIALQAFNTAPVEALVRTISYYLRERRSGADPAHMHFVELGCGAAANLIWLAQRGLRVSGVDISPTALRLARERLGALGLSDRVGTLAEASVVDVGLEDSGYDGVIEACVFQHLDKPARKRAFSEVRRLLKPGGVFVGYMLESHHTVFQAKIHEQLPNDPGTLMLQDGSSNIHLTNIGLSHFFSRDELFDLLSGFSVVDPCLTTYYLPKSEAKKRGYGEYLQSMWTVYAVK